MTVLVIGKVLGAMLGVHGLASMLVERIPDTG